MGQYQSLPISQWQPGTQVLSTDVYVATDTVDLTQSSAGSTYKYTMQQLLEFVSANVGVIQWQIVTVTTQQLAIDNGYVCEAGASLITYTLPLLATLGTVIKIAGYAPGLFTIAQNAGQQIILGDIETTAGTLGSFNSMSTGDFVELTCIVPNTVWQVTASIGNFTLD